MAAHDSRAHARPGTEQTARRVYLEPSKQGKPEEPLWHWHKIEAREGGFEVNA